MSTQSGPTMESQQVTRRTMREAERARAGAGMHAGVRSVPASVEAPKATAETETSRRWVPRLALLGALGAVTIVAPLTGVGTVGVAHAESEPTGRTTVAGTGTLVDRLSTGGIEIEDAAALTADPDAASRAITTASRSYMREAMECPVETVANGAISAAMGAETPAQVVMPVAEGSYRITSKYGYRSYPFRGMHEGTDFAGTLGTPLHAVADGVVTYAGGPRDGRTGHIIVVEAEVEGDTVEFWYGHMYASGMYAEVGDEVEAGDVIGEIGNDGRSTGPHLHFEVHTPNSETTVDPLVWLEQNDAKPVSALVNCAA